MVISRWARIRVIAAAALGISTTIGLAWLSAAYVVPGHAGAGSCAQRGGYCHYDRSHGVGIDVVWMACYRTQQPVEVAPCALPSWATYIRPPEGAWQGVTYRAAGWPMRCVRSHRLHKSQSSAGDNVWRWAITLRSDDAAAGDRLLPLRPVFAGMIVDLAVWCGGWWVLFWALSRLEKPANRFIGRMMIALALGAVSTFAMAWTCALNDYTFAVETATVHRDSTDESRPYWAPQAAWIKEMKYLASGWPCRCLVARHFFDVYEANERWDDAIVLHRSVRGAQVERVLPLAIVWRGLLANVLFWSAICWVPLGAPHATQRVRRWNRGLCIVCGYDLKHVNSPACPECGTRVKQIKSNLPAPCRPEGVRDA